MWRIRACCWRISIINGWHSLSSMVEIYGGWNCERVSLHDLFIVGFLGDVTCTQTIIVLVDSIVLFICSYWIVIRLIIIIIYDSCSKTKNWYFVRLLILFLNRKNCYPRRLQSRWCWISRSLVGAGLSSLRRKRCFLLRCMLVSNFCSNGFLLWDVPKGN